MSIECRSFTCPVCGWGGLEYDPSCPSHELCDCCAFEFGYDDVPEKGTVKVMAISSSGEILPESEVPNSSPYTTKEGMYEFHRNYWVSSGMRWRYGKPPKNWNPIEQLSKVNKNKT